MSRLTLCRCYVMGQHYVILLWARHLAHFMGLPYVESTFWQVDVLSLHLFYYYTECHYIELCWVSWRLDSCTAFKRDFCECWLFKISLFAKIIFWEKFSVKTGCGKCPSSLRYGNNYGYKKFYIKGPWGMLLISYHNKLECLSMSVTSTQV